MKIFCCHFLSIDFRKHTQTPYVCVFKWETQCDYIIFIMMISSLEYCRCVTFKTAAIQTNNRFFPSTFDMFCLQSQFRIEMAICLLSWLFPPRIWFLSHHLFDTEKECLRVSARAHPEHEWSIGISIYWMTAPQTHTTIVNVIVIEKQNERNIEKHY